LDEDLMAELAGSGVKYTADDVLMVVRDTDGRLLWLEKGGSDAGLEHIIEGHVEDFMRRGIAEKDIPEFIHDMIANHEPIKTGANQAGSYSVYLINGEGFRVAFGSNGFIVSCYPSRL
jgi:hypothetical protein